MIVLPKELAALQWVRDNPRQCGIQVPMDTVRPYLTDLEVLGLVEYLNPSPPSWNSFGWVITDLGLAQC